MLPRQLSIRAADQRAWLFEACCCLRLSTLPAGRKIAHNLRAALVGHLSTGRSLVTSAVRARGFNSDDDLHQLVGHGRVRGLHPSWTSICVVSNRPEPALSLLLV